MKTSSSAAPVIVGLSLATFALATIYIFSCGPAVYLRETEVISDEAVDRFYWPLAWLEQNSTPCKEAIEWYASLWMPDVP